ncbi:MAG TPA: hypothetical protein VG939_03480 [Caulobacteraceae bacterium]|nr:hypothetical protein [Caulobacteraceae bacterium]
MRFVSVLAAALPAAVLVCTPQAVSAKELKCSDLMDIALPHAAVQRVTSERLSARTKACRFVVSSKPAPDSEVRIEVWVPVGAAWNGAYAQLGTGDQGEGLERLAGQGYAVATGTERKAEDAAGANRRAMRETAAVARTLVASQKGFAPNRAWLDACGAGNREILARGLPEGFDGVLFNDRPQTLPRRPGAVALRCGMLARPRP